MIWLNQKILGKQEKCLFGHTTKQLLSNFEPWKSRKYKQLWGLGPNPSCLFAYKKKCCMIIQIFCRTERKSRHLVLLCVLLRRFHETRMMREKKLLACQILRRKCSWTTSSSTRMLLFWQRHQDNSYRVFRQERSWVRHLSVRYIFPSCFIDNNAHISLYILFFS